jgi:cation transport ATPase
MRWRLAMPFAGGGGGWLESGDTVVVGDATGCLALFRIGDEIRPESAALVAELLVPERKWCLLTGDAPAVARRVAAALGIETFAPARRRRASMIASPRCRRRGGRGDGR